MKLIDINAYDPVLEEVYAIRRKISEKYGHDTDRYFAAMLERHKDDEAKGIRYVRLPIARTAPAPATAQPTP